jgi:carbon storage regulator
VLVLSRKKEEEIHIGNGVVVRVIAISGDRVKLGLTAPKDMNIVRSELLKRNAEASQKDGLERQTT